MISNTDEEKKSMLDDHLEESESEQDVQWLHPRQKRTHCRLLIGQMIFLAFNLFLLRLGYSSWTNTDDRPESGQFKETFSPAESSIQFTVRTFDAHPKNSVFDGEPRQELDQAWSDLLYPTILSVTEDEMRAMNKTSLSLKDGTGYAGYLEAYHMLHCVKRIYQYEHSDYYPDLVSSGKLSTKHWEHCLQVLRQGIMCNPNPSINTYSWDPSDPTEVIGHTFWPRKCVDWSQFETWAHERALGWEWRDELVHSGELDVMGPKDLLS